MEYGIVTLPLTGVSEFWQTFRELLENEFPGYSKNVVRHFLEQTYNEGAFAYFIQTHQKTVLAARKGTEVIGFAVIDMPYGGVSLCRWLGVKKKYQKHGIGKKLIEKWLEFARLQGCHKAEVASQPGAREFYAKAGLRLEGKREKSYFGIDQYIFGKVLGPVREEILTK